MSPALIILGLAGVGLLLASSSKKDNGARSELKGLPTTKRLSYRVVANPPLGELRIGPATVLLDGFPIKQDDSLERHRSVARELQNAFAARKATLPSGANQQNDDDYSQEAYWAPSWLTMLKPDTLTAYDLKTAVNGSPIDEYGRHYEGQFGGGPHSIWDKTLGGLLKNPLFAAVVTAAVLVAPGGIALYGAYSLWQMRGQELTLKNAALTAGRAYVTAQCGPGCGAAFDFGVGVASGKKVDKAAEETLTNQMSPAERAAYDNGKTALRKVM